MDKEPMITTAKTIQMLLYDGDLNGVMYIEDTSWQIGAMFSSPRQSIDDLIAKADCRKYGVYLLLSEEQVYVGQARDLEKRTRQHLTDKGWWSHIILMTTKDDSFNASDIDYLESKLIEKAKEVGTAYVDNLTKGNPQKVSAFREVELGKYLEEALFLLKLIGVFVFEPVNRKRKAPPLPEGNMSVSDFVKTAMINLLAAGYVFSDEQLKLYSSVEGSKEYTHRALPILYLLKDGETREDVKKKIRQRYWKEEFSSGGQRFLMFSQWFKEGTNYGAHKEDFIRWYSNL
ncbi:GIY-YIG nuclease family protein [Anaerovibrio sp. RM50]|uniref:GIY-YIG nuclease family protein n=1 Tax=Anaerovibrio sp. RM50 TaxID=1200557 RepID=UPI000687FF1A|nr:GIY-YIG nuclease family protein [Anaerovibrio sp. RM50]